MAAIKEYLSSQVEQINDRYVTLRYKVDEHSQKLGQLGLAVDGVKGMTMNGSAMSPPSNGNALNIADMETELRVMREFV